MDQNAPFIVEWEPQNIAAVAAAIRSPYIGAVVVAYRRNTIRLLQDCLVSGSYASSGTGTYTGMLQVRSSDAAYVTAGVQVGALQQISTSAAIAQSTLLTYRFVIVGHYDVTGSRPFAGLLDLRERAPDGCRGATHFVRGASTGAFERLSDAYGGAGVQASGPGVGAGIAGQSQQTIGARGGDYARCVGIGVPTAPECQAILKIELGPIQPARVALRLSGFSVNGQPAPNLRFRFRNKNHYMVDTPSFFVASALTDVTLNTAEIAEDAPIVVEAIQQSAQGAAIIGTGQVTPTDVRRAAMNRGPITIDLRNQPIGVIGTVQLAFAPATSW